MGQVTLTLNGRSYRVGCGDGEEARLSELGDHVREKVDTLAAEFGQVGEARLLLLASLLITDELFDARTAKAAEASTASAAALREMANRVKVESKALPNPATEPQAPAVMTDKPGLSSLQPAANRQPNAPATEPDTRKAG